MSEEWRAVEGFPNYEVSNLGRVRSVIVHMMRPHPSHTTRYMQVCLRRQGRKHNKLVHRLVAEAFFGKSSLQVNHKDNVRSHNALDNLEYVTAQGNADHRRVMDRNPYGERSGTAKVKENDVLKIRQAWLTKSATQRALAKQYSLSTSAVWDLVQGNSWAHLPVSLAEVEQLLNRRIPQ